MIALTLFILTRSLDKHASGMLDRRLKFTIMKTLSILAYIIGSGLLIASCFTTGVS